MDFMLIAFLWKIFGYFQLSKYIYTSKLMQQKLRNRYKEKEQLNQPTVIKVGQNLRIVEILSMG